MTRKIEKFHMGLLKIVVYSFKALSEGELFLHQ